MLSGPPCCSTRPRAMDRGPRSTITTGPGPVRASLTALARSAIVDVLAQHPAGAGTFDRGPDRPGATDRTKGRTPTTASPSPTPAHRTPTRRVQRRWGGSTPNHPAALRSGMQMGSDSPEQQHTFSTPDPSGRGHKFQYSCDMGWYHPEQVLSYGFQAVATLHGTRLDLPHLCTAHQRSPGTPMPWLV